MLEEEAFYVLIQHALYKIKAEEPVKDDKWISTEEAVHKLCITRHGHPTMQLAFSMAKSAIYNQTCILNWNSIILQGLIAVTNLQTVQYGDNQYRGKIFNLDNIWGRYRHFCGGNIF